MTALTPSKKLAVSGVPWWEVGGATILGSRRCFAALLSEAEIKVGAQCDELS